MKDLGEHLEIAEAILKELTRGSLRRTALEKRVFKSKEISYSTFGWMFAFLVADGDIEKVSALHEAPFRLTEKGKAFLVWRTKS
jgi:predicted transcriptional regulator